ncbi:hypothetical protein [Bowdeniella nasicola]|uniref:hypothetical protein n=1 Tax=Bowdeniella nasicola TaxID=208480 RepID=UPI0011613B74|nr:hypothetical protein [Bowdeniella nasicola]
MNAVVAAVTTVIASQEEHGRGEIVLQLADPMGVLQMIVEAARHPGVCIGVGADSGGGRSRLTPLDYARRALKRARSRSGDMPVVIYGRATEAASWATSLAQLVHFCLLRRSEPGWEVSRLVARGISQKDAAEDLGITEQAVSQRLRAAGFREVRNIEPLLLCLLEQAAHIPTR